MAHTHGPETGRDPVIVERESGSGIGLLIGGLFAILAIGVLFWVLFGTGIFSGAGSGADINVPREIDVNIDQPRGGGSGGGGMEGGGTQGGGGSGQTGP